MLEKIPDVPGGIDAFRAVGTLTKDDYEQTVEPLLDEARREGRRLRLLLQFGPEFEGFTAGAVWGKTETWLQFPALLRMIDGYAIVSDLRWMREWIHLVGFLVPFPLRVFDNDQRDEAFAWLGSLPEGPGVTHRVLPDSGVIVVEVTQPLRAQDFDALAATADAWLATHDECQASSCTPAHSPAGRTSAACCAMSASCVTTTARCDGSRWPPTPSWRICCHASPSTSSRPSSGTSATTSSTTPSRGPPDRTAGRRRRQRSSRRSCRGRGPASRRRGGSARAS